MTECSKCKKSYKKLTKDGLCFFCHKDVFGEVPREFRDDVNLSKEKNDTKN